MLSKTELKTNRLRPKQKNIIGDNEDTIELKSPGQDDTSDSRKAVTQLQAVMVLYNACFKPPSDDPESTALCNMLH